MTAMELRPALSLPSPTDADGHADRDVRRLPRLKIQQALQLLAEQGELAQNGF